MDSWTVGLTVKVKFGSGVNGALMLVSHALVSFQLVKLFVKD